MRQLEVAYAPLRTRVNTKENEYGQTRMQRILERKKKQNEREKKGRGFQRE